LGDPLASKLEVFPWLKLQISMGVERGEREKKGVLHGLERVKSW
jgi:hypothetical protein